MKKITLILTSMLFLLVGGVFSHTVNLPIKGGYDWSATDGSNNWNQVSDVSYTTGTVTIADNYWGSYGSFNNIKKGCVGGTHWATAWSTGETHTFTVTLANDTKAGQDLTIIAVNATENGKIEGNFNHVAYAYINTSDSKTLTLDVTDDYAAVYICTKSDGSSKPHQFKISSITRTVTGGGGGGGSALDGKTAVTYNIPGKNVLFSDSFDDNLNKWSSLNTDRGTVEWDGTIGHDSNGCMKVVNNESRPSEQWRIQRHASFSTISSGTTFYISFYIKCESETGSIRCSTTGNNKQYQGDQEVSTAWKQIIWEVTAEGDIDGFCLDMAHTANTYYIDDVEVYTNAATGGSNVFTSDDQVANISSSAFSSLAEGDYICADVTGTPGTIKLVCDGTDYDLTQFNGGTLWGRKATADMVTALKTNNSQFKGHDLTLNGINIYKTVALGEGANEISLYNNVFVELTRTFTGGTWNTVCLPFVPSAEQATELFGSGYKLAKFTASGTNKMTFTTIDLDNEEFVAGKPYLVYPTANLSHSNKVLANVSITETEGSRDEDNDYKFKGSFEPISFSSNLSLYRFIASGNELKTPTVSTLKSLRCYFEYPSGGNARSFTIDEEGGTTGINAVNGEGFMVNGYYNLNGQRVAKPTKGLYIVNGKKVVIK